MQDDDKVVNKDEEATLVTESAPVEEKPVEEVKEETPEQPKTEEVPKKSAEGRIRELNAKAKLAEERAESLAEQLQALTSQVGPEAQQPQYTPEVAQGQEEITPDQYKADVYKTADSLVNLRLQQERMINRLNQEAQELIQEHPELNPDSENFNRELSDSITEAALAYAKSNPANSLKGFVKKLIAPYKKAITKEVAKQSETLVKQASEGALRPTNVKQTEKPFSELPIEEMEKKLGVVY